MVGAEGGRERPVEHEIDIERDVRIRARMWASLRRLSRSKGGLFGAAVVLLLVILAVFAPWISPHDPLAQNLSAANSPPFWSDGGSTEYLVGTDTLGRDILSRLIYGTRVSLTVALGGVAIGASFGMLLGLLAGYAGGKTDAVIVGMVNLLLSLPYLLFVVFVVAVVGQSLVNVILIFGITSIPIFARVTRVRCSRSARAPSSKQRATSAFRAVRSSDRTCCRTWSVRWPRWPPSKCRP